MGIELGLSKITKLLLYAGNPQKSLKVLHVAGTNGKGSVCSYLSTMLKNPSNPAVKIGKFTTPHLVDITDSIVVNNIPIPKTEFVSIRESLSQLNNKHLLQCSEFELLTCVAFSYFKKVECSWCVLEVGLGGRLDATNVVPGIIKYACGITKIGLDHQSFLGNTLGEIAFEKAGIITKGVPFAVVDGTNDKSIIDVVKKQCSDMECTLKITDTDINNNYILTESWGNIKFKKMPLNGEYQIFNLRIALGILDHLQQTKEVSLSLDDIHNRLASMEWPGRLQNLDFCFNKSQKIPILLDGAHNGCAAEELEKFIRSTYGTQPLTFVIAVTSGKDLDPLFGPLLRSSDSVITTQFGSVDGMPWIKPIDPEDLANIIKEKYTTNVTVEPNLSTMFQNLIKSRELEKNNNPIIVCGSLYLCGNLLEIHNNNSH